MQTQINIKLLFFGFCRDLAGIGQIEMVVDNSSSVFDVLSKLRKLYPGFVRLNLQHAVNEEYVDDSMTLKDGDQLAIFTAVSGG